MLSGQIDPIDDLVTALVSGTRQGSISWRQADARGTAYIAKRPSGTVTIQRPTSGLAAALAGSVRLVVKNELGETIREFPSGTFSVGVGSSTLAASQLSELYNLVETQLSGKDQTVRQLATEFRTSSG
jgi:hypothetical protein